jgi:cobalt-zinc-cadmium efflux system protein
MTRSQRLGIALALNLALVAGQVVFGVVAHSLGLLADAGHNLTDAAAVLIALIAVRLGRRPPTPSHSYGYHRATILAALANAVALLVVTVAIMYEAITRLFHPEPVRGGIVVLVALAAVIVNLGAALVLYERRFDLNMRSALLHMSADAAASLGVAAAGLVILLTGGFEWLDPAVSIGIATMIAIEAWRLVRAAVDVLLEATPDDIDLPALRATILSVDNVVDVHDLHVWSLSSGIRALSAHVVVGSQPSLGEAEEVGKHVKAAIGETFAIAHATLELENADGNGDARDCVPDAQRHVPE